MPEAWERTRFGRAEARTRIWVLPLSGAGGEGLGRVVRAGGVPQDDTARARIVVDEVAVMFVCGTEGSRYSDERVSVLIWVSSSQCVIFGEVCCSFCE